MSHAHQHTHAHEPHHHHGETLGVKAVAATPTLSLLRMSAAGRLAGAAVLSVLLWAATLAVLG